MCFSRRQGLEWSGYILCLYASMEPFYDDISLSCDVHAIFDKARGQESYFICGDWKWSAFSITSPQSWTPEAVMVSIDPVWLKLIFLPQVLWQGENVCRWKCNSKSSTSSFQLQIQCLNAARHFLLMSKCTGAVKDMPRAPMKAERCKNWMIKVKAPN